MSVSVTNFNNLVYFLLAFMTCFNDRTFEQFRLTRTLYKLSYDYCCSLVVPVVRGEVDHGYCHSYY